MRYKSYKNFFFSLLLITSCGTNINTQDAKVTFDIEVPENLFSNKNNINVTIYNEEELKKSQNNSECSVSYNSETKEEKISCPDGVTYQEVNPEKFEYNLEDIDNNITLNSKTVMVGEKYRLSVTGLSSDGCNTASGGVEEIANSSVIKLKDLSWSQTEKACL